MPQSITTPITTPVGWLGGLLDAVGSHQHGSKWQCPAHGTSGDHTPSLAVGERTKNGLGAWVHCHAGCTGDDILRALHLSRGDLRIPPPITPAAHAATLRLTFPAPKIPAGGSLAQQGFRFEREHPYTSVHEPRTVVAWKLRYRNRSGAKEIRWESLNSAGERAPGLLGRPQSQLLLYRFPDWRVGALAGETVYLVESESSVDSLMRAGLYATCWPGGAGDPPERQIKRLLGHLADQVVIVPDHDAAGLACARKLHTWLPEARLVLGAPGEDARDILRRLGQAGFGDTRPWWSRVDWAA